jgi:hypothetical protein
MDAPESVRRTIKVNTWFHGISSILNTVLKLCYFVSLLPQLLLPQSQVPNHIFLFEKNFSQFCSYVATVVHSGVGGMCAHCRFDVHMYKVMGIIAF